METSTSGNLSEEVFNCSAWGLDSEEELLYSLGNYSLSDEDANFIYTYCFHRSFQFPTLFRVLVYIMYNLIFIVGLFGNLIVVYIIICSGSKSVKTVGNYFLANLALGDILIAGLSIPFGYIAILWQYWPFGATLCHLVNPAKAVGVFVSSYTLIALAVDRYFAIIHPLRPRMSLIQAAVIVVIIWIAAVVTAIPGAVYTRLEIYDGTGLPRCSEYGWDDSTLLVYDLTLLILQYFLPVLVLVYTYSRICLVVWGKRITSYQTEGHDACRDVTTSRARKKTVLISLAVVLGYTLAWLPYNIFHILLTHFVVVQPKDASPYAFLACHWLSMAHSTFNPFIYFWMHSKLRNVFVDLLVQSRFPLCVQLGLRLKKMFSQSPRDSNRWSSKFTTSTTVSKNRTSLLSQTSVRKSWNRQLSNSSCIEQPVVVNGNSNAANVFTPVTIVECKDEGYGAENCLLPRNNEQEDCK